MRSTVLVLVCVASNGYPPVSSLLPVLIINSKNSIYARERVTTPSTMSSEMTTSHWLSLPTTIISRTGSFSVATTIPPFGLWIVLSVNCKRCFLFPQNVVRCIAWLWHRNTCLPRSIDQLWLWILLNATGNSHRLGASSERTCFDEGHSLFATSFSDDVETHWRSIDVKSSFLFRVWK